MVNNTRPLPDSRCHIEMIPTIENEVIEKKLRYNNVLEISSPVDRKEFIYVFHKSTEINKLLQRFLTFKTKFHFYDFSNILEFK